MMGNTRRRVLLICVIGIVVVWFWPRDPLAGKIPGPLPASARLDHAHHHQAGFDHSYAFRFAVTDDALRDKLIADWKLARVADVTQNATSFVSLDPPLWWPVARLEALQERWEREEDASERYWIVWIDRENDWLYAEYGRW